LGESDETSIGIANVRKRLRLYYGEAARMTITSRLHEGTQVSIVIPTGVLNVPRVSD
jgi:two-component system sensor histidine kinase YesM